MLKKFIIILIFSIILTSESFADKMRECTLTPEICSVGLLPNTKNSNNLTQNYTSFETARGKKILIKGKVLDNNCVPISGVKVNIGKLTPLISINSAQMTSTMSVMTKTLEALEIHEPTT